MARTLVPIYIAEDPMWNGEQFYELGSEFQLGNLGTVHIGPRAFVDGDPIFLDLKTCIVRRNPGIRELLMLIDHSNQRREFIFDGDTWYQVVETTERVSASKFSTYVGHHGTSLGTYRWGSEKIDQFEDHLFRWLSPIFVLPLLLFQLTEKLVGIAFILYFSIIVLMVFGGLVLALFS